MGHCEVKLGAKALSKRRQHTVLHRLQDALVGPEKMRHSCQVDSNHLPLHPRKFSTSLELQAPGVSPQAILATAIATTLVRFRSDRQAQW